MSSASLVADFRKTFAATAPGERAPMVRRMIASELSASDCFQIVDAAYALDPSATIGALMDLPGQVAHLGQLRQFVVWHLMRQGDFAAARNAAREFAASMPQASTLHEAVLRSSLLMSPEEAWDGWKGSGASVFPALKRSSYHALIAATTGHADAQAAMDKWWREVEARRDAAFRDAAAADPKAADFLESFRAVGSIALVGNGPSLSGAKRGAVIDGFDMVVRVNFPVIDGRASDVGSRTDGIFFTETIMMGQDLARLLARDAGYPGARIASFEGSTGGARITDARERMAALGADRYCRLPVAVRHLLVAMGYDGHTTGFATLMFLAILLRKRVRLFGFDFYGAGPHNYWSAGAPQPPLHHELQFERFYIERFLGPRFDVTRDAG